MRFVSVGLILCLALPARAAEPPSDAGKTYEVPYRLTDTKHVLVRARINGKGPFNFILDTGSPVLFISSAVCKKAGVEAGEDAVAGVDRFELEGGLVATKIKVRAGDPVQLESMNKLGLAGVELHGVIGYDFLARYRIEYDLTKDKLPWTRLDFDPPPPPKFNGKLVGGADSISGVVSVASKLLGPAPLDRSPRFRGSLGVELTTQGGGVVVNAVLKDSPAAAAGLAVGDRITEVEGKAVKDLAGLLERAAKLKAGDKLRLTVLRGEETHQFAVPLAEGF